jgi:hypothetical protein
MGKFSFNFFTNEGKEVNTKLFEVKMVMLNIRLLILVMICFFFPVRSVLALMPPEKIAERNLEAKLILIGEVKRTGKLILPEKESKTEPLKGLFVIKVLHVVKGFGAVSPGDQVKIIYHLPKKGLLGASVKETGGIHVKVKAGNLVVVYIDSSWHQGFYRPVAAGSSVVIIDPGKILTEKKIGKQ